MITACIVFVIVAPIVAVAWYDHRLEDLDGWYESMR